MDQEICRTCLRKPPRLISLLENFQLIQKIEIISSVQISIEDNLPNTVCEECVKNINKFSHFRNTIVNSDIELKERLAVLQKKMISDVESTQNTEVKIPVESIKVELPSDISENEPVEITNFIIIKNEPDTFNNTMQLVSLNKMIKTKNGRMTKKKIIIPDGPVPIRQPRRVEKKVYKCQKCEFSCTEILKWQSHKRNYHITPGICNICGKSMRRENVSTHIKSHSSPPVPCKICGRIFKNSESLRTHMVVHSGVKNICTICGKIFAYKSCLRRHMRIYHDGQQKKEKCTLCEKTFTCKAYLRKHLFTHTGKRPYTCEYCKKALASAQALRAHIRRHINERPYICEYCSAAFPQKVSLMTHIKSKHKTDNSNSECDTPDQEI